VVLGGRRPPLVLQNRAFEGGVPALAGGELDVRGGELLAGLYEELEVHILLSRSDVP
jgi:hypothetical protein